MGIFSKMTTEGVEESGDRLGGGFAAVPTDVYDAIIKMVYVQKQPDSESTSVTIIADMGGKELRSRQWITSKLGVNTYPDKQDAKKKHFLPGYIVVNDLCQLTTGMELTDLDEGSDIEDKMVLIYSATDRKEVPTAAKVITAMIGKPVKLGVLRISKNKQKKNDSGKYVDLAEKRTENEIDKVFHHETGRTVTEYRHNVDPGEFMPAWIKQNQGKDRDLYKEPGAVGAAGGGIGGAGRPGGAGGSTAKKNIFNS